MDCPGLAALAVWPVQVRVGALRVTIPPTPAHRWIAAIVAGDALGIVPGMVAGSGPLLDAIAAGDATAGQCRDAARHAIDAASGFRWWTAGRLVHLSVGAPWIAGELVLAGVDAQRVPLGAWCVAVWRLAVRDRDKKDLARIEWELTKPPQDVAVGDLYDERRAASAFDAVPDDEPMVV